VAAPEPRSVQQPENVKDLFDQRSGFPQARQVLTALGLLSPEDAAAVDRREREIGSQLAAAIRFDPGTPVRLIEHDGKFYAYAEIDGQPSFTEVTPTPSADVPLAPTPTPEPTPGGGE